MCSQRIAFIVRPTATTNHSRLNKTRTRCLSVAQANDIHNSLSHCCGWKKFSSVRMIPRYCSRLFVENETHDPRMNAQNDRQSLLTTVRLGHQIYFDDNVRRTSRSVASSHQPLDTSARLLLQVKYLKNEIVYFCVWWSFIGMKMCLFYAHRTFLPCTCLRWKETALLTHHGRQHVQFIHLYDMQLSM